MKNLLFVGSLFLCLSFTGQIPTAGLLGYYPFNGNANDLSGNAQNGTVIGATLTADRFGNSNSAYSFNGASNYISLPTTSYLGLNIYSYSFWMKPTQYPSVGALPICVGENGSYCQAVTYQSGGTIFAGSYNNGSSPLQSYVTSTSMSINQWIHVVVTRDFSSIKLYVNGLLYSSGTGNTNSQAASYGTTSPYRALIGARSNLTYYFSGLIDDIRIYSTALTQLDVNALYNESCFQNVTNSLYAICSGNSATISAAPASSNTINWYSSPTSTSSIGSGSVLSTPTLGVGTYTYYAGASTCTLANQRLPITVSVSPSPIISVGNGTICSGNSFAISPTGATSYSYSNGSVVSPSVTTSYTVVGQNSSGCISNVASLTVNVNTTPTISVNSGFVCSGQSFTLTPSGASSYTYSGGSAVVTPNANTSYTVTGSNGNGCYGSAVSNVGVVATPTLVVSNSGNVCLGNSINLSVSGANFYTWDSGSTSATINVTPTITTTYTVSGVNLFGCLGSTVTTVNVNPLPFISVNSGSVCLGSPFIIVPSGAATYTYSGGTNIVSPIVNTSYSITGTSAQGCISSNTAVSNVFVMSLPVISVNSGSVCAGNAFTLIPSGGVSYTYSGGSSVVSPATTTAYTVTGAGANGCSNVAVSNVTAVALPIVTISGPTDICIGDNGILTASGAGTFSWNTGATNSTISISPLSNTVYSVVGFNASGCQNFATKPVFARSLPVMTVNSGSVCLGSSFTINPSGAPTYTITGGNNIVSPLTNTNYTITGTNSFGCSSKVVSSVNVVATPTIAVNSGTICAGKSFTMVPSGGVSYVYSSGSAVVSPASNTQYTVTGFNASGCSASALSSVVVDALPNVSISGSTSICNGNSTILSANGANSYVWNTGPTSQTILVTPSSSTSYSVIGTGLNGCTNTAMVALTVNPLPIISVNSGSVCLGNSFTLVPSGASSYTYSGGSNIVSPTSTTNYSVTGMSAQGCLSSNVAVASVTVVSLPLITVNSGSICSGKTFTMIPSGATTYSYSNGSNTVIPTINSSYTVNGINAQGCISAPAVSNVTVIALPLVSVNSGSICAGSSFTILPSGASSYTISGGSSVVSPAATTSYSVTGTSLVGCISTVAISNVVVNALPVISVNSGSVCSGNVFVMTPTGAATYVYSNGSNSVIPTVNSNYTITGISSQGCPSSNSVVSSVTVVALPIITVNSGTICSGSSFTMIPSGASSYTFSGGSAIVSPTVTTAYSVTGTSSLGCVSSIPSISNLTVLATPSISVIGSASVCSGSSVNYTASGASSYTWSTGAQTQTIVVTPSVNTTYTVLGSNVSGCIGIKTQSVQVNATPLITANSGSVCIGNSYVINPSGANTYSYSSGNATVSPVSNTTYSITGFSSAGCASNVTTITVVVNPLPTITVVGTTSVCDGNSTTFTTSGASTYFWSNGSSGNPVSITPSVTGNYTVNGVDLNGCSADATVQIIVNPNPTITVNSGAICPGNSFTFNPTGAVSYTYSSGSNIIFPTSTDTYTVFGTSSDGCVSTIPAIATVSVVNSLTVSVTGNTSICNGESTSITANGASSYIWSTGALANAVVLSPSVTTNYTVMGVSGTCSNDAVFSITVLPSPVITVNSTTICFGSSFTINPSGASSYTYSSGTAIVNPSTTTNYTVLGGNSFGCLSYAVSTVVVNQLPNVIALSSQPNIICVGEEATLIGSGALNYTWNPGSVSGSTLVVTPSVTTIYTLTGKDLNGCVNRTTVVQNVDGCIGITNIKKQNVSTFVIYPNPINGSFSIQYDLNTNLPAELLIIDLQGKILKNYTLDAFEKNYEVSQPELKPGVYFCKIKLDGKILAVKKIIVTN